MRTLLLLLLSATGVLAQDFRVTAPERAVQMRVQVLYASGTPLFDSDWKGGNILDVDALPYGSYQLVISSRDVDGKVTEKRTTLRVAPDRASIDPALPDDLKLTTTAHDGTTGQIITTSGSLSFRFGDYLNKKDTEAMRLSPEGNLEVQGWIKAGQGFVLADGSTVDVKKLKAKADAAGTGTLNQVAKWGETGGAGTLIDSAIAEVSGNVGIGTATPSGKLHIFGTATQDVFAGMGVDMIAGPAFNFGYGGASFGRGAGFFNVRPDASAVAPNPSLRFMTGNVERMIVTNAGNVGIGTSTPGGRFHIYAAPTADVFAGIGTDMSAGPSMNFGYGGATFGRGAGFFNARPDAGATPPNPSLRFMTNNVERMIVTRDGYVGIGTSSPGLTLDVAGNVGVSNAIVLPATTSATEGVIKLGITPFIHNFGAINTFVGNYAGNFTMTGSENTGIGYNSLTSVTTGVKNTGVGISSLVSTTTGSYNTAIGRNALANNITGNNNTAIGEDALQLNTGFNNIAIGDLAGTNLTTGSLNIDIGNPGVAGESSAIRIGASQTRAFIAGIRGISPVAANGQGVLIDSNGQLGTIGDVSFSNNILLPATTSTTGALFINSNRFLHAAGSNNTFLGSNAGNFTMSGGGNTGIGDSVLTNNTFGLQNTAVGWSSMESNSNGYSNTAVGWETLKVSSSGAVNTAIGNRALKSNTTGSDNTALGGNTLENNTTGSNNIAVGFAAAGSIVAGNYNIDIGTSSPGDESNTIRIGNAINHSRAFMAGIRNVTTSVADGVPVMIDSNGQLGTTSSSIRYKFDVNDMAGATDRITELRPVTFRYKKHGENAPLQYGLIAEEVATVYPELVARDKDGRPETVMYQFLTPMLLNEVQKQKKTIRDQQSVIESLMSTLATVNQRLAAVEKQMAIK